MADDIKSKKISELPQGGFNSGGLDLNQDSLLPVVVNGTTTAMDPGGLFAAMPAPQGTKLDDLRKNGRSGLYSFTAAQATTDNGFPDNADVWGPSTVVFVSTQNNTTAQECLQRAYYVPDAPTGDRAITWERFYHGGNWSYWYDLSDINIPEASTTERGVVTIAPAAASGQAGVVTGNLLFQYLAKLAIGNTTLTNIDNVTADGLYNWAGGAGSPGNAAGTLIVLGGALAQQFISRTESKIYARSRANTGVAYSSWIAIGGVDVATIVAGRGGALDNIIRVDTDANTMRVPRVDQSLAAGVGLNISQNAGTQNSVLALTLSTDENNSLSIIPRGDPRGEGLFAPKPSGGSGIVELAAGTILDSVTTQNVYLIHGSNNPAVTKHPFTGNQNDRMIMSVSSTSDADASNQRFIQIIFASNIASQPSPWIRMRVANVWQPWQQLVDTATMQAKNTGYAVLSQSGLNIHNTVTRVPRTAAYKAPGSGSVTPASAPSAFAGMLLQLPWEYSTSQTGTFGGVVMAADANGDVYFNLDKNIPDNGGQPGSGSVNWKKVAYEGVAPAGVFAAPVTSLVSGTTIDTVITPGAYHQDTGANATVALGYPEEGTAGSLVVTIVGTQTYMQQYFSNLINVSWTRFFRGGQWQAWERNWDKSQWDTPARAVTNADNTKVAGTYWTNDSAQTIAANGWPAQDSGSQFMLQVYTNGRQICQIAQSLRGYVWTRYSDTAGVLSQTWALTAVIKGTVSPGSPNLTLPAATNLNNVTVTGLYFQETGANATTALNYPIQHVGTLQVTAVVPATSLITLPTFVRQEYTSHNSPNTRYYREYSNSAWSAWTLMQVTQVTSPAAWIADTGVSSKTPNSMTSFPNVDQGVYSYAAATVTPANGFPVNNTLCQLAVFGGVNNSMTQVCYVPSTGDTWTRSRTGATFSTWQKTPKGIGKVQIQNIASQLPDAKKVSLITLSLTPNAYFMIDLKIIVDAADATRGISFAYNEVQVVGQSIDEIWPTPVSVPQKVVFMPSIAVFTPADGQVTLTADIAVTSGTGNTSPLKVKAIAVPVT